MYNADRIEGFGKLARYLNLLPEKDPRNGWSLGANTATSSQWPFACPSAVADQQMSGGPLFRRPFLFDDDSNLSLLSAAAFFVPKGFFGDLLLSQYLFKSGM